MAASTDSSGGRGPLGPPLPLLGPPLALPAPLARPPEALPLLAPPLFGPAARTQQDRAPGHARDLAVTSSAQVKGMDCSAASRIADKKHACLVEKVAGVWVLYLLLYGLIRFGG